MKILIDDKVILELDEVQLKVWRDEIPDENLQEELEFRIRSAILDKYHKIYKRMEEYWVPQLRTLGVKSIPLDEKEFAELVFSQPSYATRTQREEQYKASKNKK